MDYIALILLGTIALSEVSRLYLTHRKTTKVAHFKQKHEGVEKMIWDLQFKVYKTQEIREQVRKEYDYMRSRIENLTQQIANWPKDKDKADKALLEDQKQVAERDLARFEAQIKALDVEINGSKKTNEYPDGASGIKDQIDSYRELGAMLQEHIKSL